MHYVGEVTFFFHIIIDMKEKNNYTERLFSPVNSVCIVFTAWLLIRKGERCEDKNYFQKTS